MNAIMERRVKTLRAELLDRTLIWNETHLRHALREYERHYNQHRTHRSLAAAAPLRARPPALEPEGIERLVIRGRTDSAESSMSTDMPFDLRGRDFSARTRLPRSEIGARPRHQIPIGDSPRR
jgi:hypothetical protein